MYQVFVENKSIFFIKNIKSNKKFFEKNNILLVKYSHIFDLKYSYEVLKKDKFLNNIIIFSNNVESNFNQFKALFKNIKAAGILLTNTNKEILLIFRNNKWDLPKGKIEKNENPKNAAIRELKEECGFETNIKINSFLCNTYHTYNLKGQNILKETFWYFAITNKKIINFNPQKKEGITEVKWVNVNDIDNYLKNSYKSISKVINNALIKFPRI